MNRYCVVLAALVAAFGCQEKGEFTLYRNSVTDANMRIHVATFNAAADTQYNDENCRLAAELFKSQPSVKVRFWCEKGGFKR